ncbi:MAG: ATP-binding protein, partial [Planctomycetota bacterium]
VTRSAFQFKPLPSIQLKGQGALVPTYQLLSEEEHLYRSRAGSDRAIFSELVGRREELATLLESVPSVAGGHGGIVSVIGEAGLGKSRLIAELLGSAEMQAVTCLEGRSLSMGSTLSFHPFIDLLRSWSGCEDTDDEAQALGKLRAAIARLLPEQLSDVFPFVTHLMGVQAPEEYRERIERIQGEAMEKQILRSMAQLLRAMASEGALVLIFDDLHWADLSSVGLLESLLKQASTHPVLFVNVFRPGFRDTSQRVLEYVRNEHAELHAELVLQPLDSRQSKRLIDNLFHSGDVPAATRSLIEEKARGNPFYVEEVVRSLVEQGAVEFRDRALFATAKIESVVIPGTIQEVVMARIDRLPAAERTVIQVASVIGLSFHYEVLAEVACKDEIDAILGHLVEVEMVVAWDQMQGVEYAFKHPLIQEVAYDSLLLSRRRELHLETARAIEIRLTENMPGFYGMLAYHFSKGRDLERAEEFLFRAGDEAARLAASSEALHFFKEASALYLDMHGERGDPRKRALLEKNIAFAYFNRGDLADAVEHINCALELRGERVPRSLASQRARFVRTMLGVLWELFGPGRWSSRAHATDDQRENIDLMFNRARAQVTASPERFLYDSMETLHRVLSVEPASVPKSGGTFAGVVGIFSWGGLSFSIGQRFLDMAGRLVGESDVEELLLYRVMRFLHYLLMGDW